jgi:hypothetical protein
VAHGAFGRVLAVWDESSAELSSSANAQRALRARSRRSPTHHRRPTGLASAVFGWVRIWVTSIEDVALLIMFLAFAWFALDWLLLILG